MTDITTVNSNSREIIGEVSFAENCAFELSDGEKLLCVTARADCNNYEALNDEFRLSVRTTFHAIILIGEEYEIREIVKENLRSVVKSGITPSSSGVFTTIVTDCALAGNNATAEIRVCGWFVKENQISFYNGETADIHCRTISKTVRNLSQVKSSRLTLTHSDECRMPIKRILDCSPSLDVNNVFPAEKSFRIEGELTLRITAVTDNNQFLTQTFTHPFGTEVEESCSSDSSVDVEGKLRGLEVTVTDGDARVIITDAEIEFFSTVAENVEINAVTDCYSTEREIIAKYSSAVSDREFCIRSIRDKASATFTPGGEITELFCALDPTVSVEAVKENDVIKAEGIISAQIFFTDEGNNPTVKTAEIPFSTEMGKQTDCELLSPAVVVNALSCRLKTGKDIEVSAEYACTVRGSVKEEIKVISSIEQGDTKPEDDYAISLYIVKPNEELWDVAKALNTDEDTLLKLNPDLKLPLSGGEKVLIYKELLFNM